MCSLEKEQKNIWIKQRLNVEFDLSVNKLI